MSVDILYEGSSCTKDVHRTFEIGQKLTIYMILFENLIYMISVTGRRQRTLTQRARKSGSTPLAALDAVATRDCLNLFASSHASKTARTDTRLWTRNATKPAIASICVSAQKLGLNQQGPKGNPGQDSNSPILPDQLGFLPRPYRRAHHKGCQTF